MFKKLRHWDLIGNWKLRIGNSVANEVRHGSVPGEVKHLSTQRNRNKIDSVSSGERKRNSPNFCLVSLLIWQEGCRDDTPKHTLRFPFRIVGYVQRRLQI